MNSLLYEKKSVHMSLLGGETTLIWRRKILEDRNKIHSMTVGSETRTKVT